MADTYVPSGEESAQEQQFLQALVGQNRGQLTSPVPRFASQLYLNFAGRYDTLAVNSAMMSATIGVSYPGLADYRALFIAYDPSIASRPDPSASVTITAGLAGTLTNNIFESGYFFTSSPGYITGTLNWGWPTPSYNISKTLPSYPNRDPLLAYYRQSFVASPLILAVPKWMRSLTIGMRIYDSLGNLQLVPIASKTNAKWQSASINSFYAPDGSYQISEIPIASLPNELGANGPLGFQWLYYIYYATMDVNTSPSQFVGTLKNYSVPAISESQVGGQSVVRISLCNYFTSFAPPLDYASQRFRVQYWADTVSYDGSAGSVTTPDLAPSPSIPDFYDPTTNSFTRQIPVTNQFITFSAPLPPSLPYTRYFRLYFGFLPSAFRQLLTGTYGIYYPPGYPTVPASLLPMGCSHDWVRIIPSMYAGVVNPVPPGFPAPPPGVPTFNSLDLSTMPLIGADITTPL